MVECVLVRFPVAIPALDPTFAYDARALLVAASASPVPTHSREREVGAIKSANARGYCANAASGWPGCVGDCHHGQVFGSDGREPSAC